MARQQRLHWRHTYQQQFATLEAAELQNDRMNPQAHQALDEAQYQLQCFRQQKLDTKFHRKATNWTTVVDRCNKEFFEHFSYGKPPVRIPELHNDGRILTEQDDLLQYAQSFYHDLYLGPPETQGVTAARNRCLSSIPCKVPENKTNGLRTAPLTLQELHDAVQALSQGKTPGLDVIPSECLRELWDTVGQDLLQFYQQVLDQGFIPENSQHRFGDSDTKIWRPTAA